MSTSAVTLVSRVRRFVGDYPDLDVTTASIASGGTTLTVADTSDLYAKNWLVQLDQEMLRVASIASGTTLTVKRGMHGTTAASHASGATVLIRPAFSDLEILDAINGAINATFPFFYKDVLDTSLTSDNNTYEFTVPSTIRFLAKVEMKQTAAFSYSEIRNWNIKRASGVGTLHFSTPPYSGTLRLWGFGPFPQLAITDTLDTAWPTWGDDPLIEYAANRLLMSSEAQRSRLNAGPQDDASQVARQGVSASIAGQLLQRFQLRLQQMPMPPMPKHITRI